MQSIEFDDIDRKILATLQQQARLSNLALAEQVGLSAAPCLRRVRALEASGVILRYVALLDARAVDFAVTVFCQVRLGRPSERELDAFEKAVGSRPEVLECYLMSGEADYLLRIVVPDVAAYERFLKDSLTRLENVASIRSTFALRQAKYSTALPIPFEQRRDPATKSRSSRHEAVDPRRDTTDGGAGRRRRKR
jgi:Lrp/AsnC family transcriptional regulator, leucine-responsive regulatory protein